MGAWTLRLVGSVSSNKRALALLTKYVHVYVGGQGHFVSVVVFAAKSALLVKHAQRFADCERTLSRCSGCLSKARLVCQNLRNVCVAFVLVKMGKNGRARALVRRSLPVCA